MDMHSELVTLGDDEEDFIGPPEEQDLVNSPSHYNMLDVEAIDIVEMSRTKDEFQGYLKGNALKYLIRYKHKGNPKQDLDKALWYLTRLKDKI